MAVAAFGMRCAFHLLQPIMGRKALQHEKRRRFLKNVDGAERAGAGKDGAERAGAGKDDAERRAFVPHGSDGDKRRGHDRRKAGRGVSGPWQGSRRRPRVGASVSPVVPRVGAFSQAFPPLRVRRGQRGGVSVPSPDVSSPCLFAVFRRRPRVAGGKGNVNLHHVEAVGVARASRGQRSGRNVMDSIAFSENLS